MAWQGAARPGAAGRGEAPQGEDCGAARHGPAGRGLACYPEARILARHGTARQGGAGHGPARLLKLPDVAERVGLSPSSYLKGVKESGFPAGFKHGSNRLWLESEIESLIERLVRDGTAEKVG